MEILGQKEGKETVRERNSQVPPLADSRAVQPEFPHLSESPKIKLDKAEKAADLHRSKTLDTFCRNGRRWKGRE
jgi:hypothetical protein